MHRDSAASTLRCTLAQGCSRLFDIECEENEVVIGGDFADVALRIAHTRRLDANICVQTLIENKDKVCCMGVSCIESAHNSAGFINIVLSNVLLERIADNIIERLPKANEIKSISTDYEYSMVKAHMISNKSDCFGEVISQRLMRKLFIDALLLCDGVTDSKKERVVKDFLTLDSKTACYDGYGKAMGAVARLMYKAQTVSAQK